MRNRDNQHGKHDDTFSWIIAWNEMKLQFKYYFFFVLKYKGIFFNSKAFLCWLFCSLFLKSNLKIQWNYLKNAWYISIKNLISKWVRLWNTAQIIKLFSNTFNYSSSYAWKTTVNRNICFWLITYSNASNQFQIWIDSYQKKNQNEHIMNPRECQYSIIIYK